MRITQPIETIAAEAESGPSLLTVSKRLHPEDIAIGDDVAVSEIACQYASFNWMGVDRTVLPPNDVVQLTYFPYGSNEPLKVMAVCLPFVLCKKVDGKSQVLDLRVTQLVRLDPAFATAARSALKSDLKEKTKTRSKSKKRHKKKRSR